MNWPTAQCEQGTVCFSCHTAPPYAPLRRVQPWPQLPPIYRNKAVASRSTETVLNALIATDEDARHGQISAATVTAVDDMWVLRQTSGADAGSWPWIQFDNEPWEAYDSAYYGAALAALAIDGAAQDYRPRPEIQADLRRMRECLTRAYAN